MENKKTTDNSVQTGLQMEADHKDAASNHDKLPVETDVDDLVHEQHDEYPTDSVEHDLDEMIHEQGSITTAKEQEDFLTEEEDMDDLVHRISDKDDNMDR